MHFFYKFMPFFLHFLSHALKANVASFDLIGIGISNQSSIFQRWWRAITQLPPPCHRNFHPAWWIGRSNACMTPVRNIHMSSPLDCMYAWSALFYSPSMYLIQPINKSLMKQTLLFKFTSVSHHRGKF